MRRLRTHLSFANVIALVALFVALGGASYAATQLPKNSVGAKQLKKNSVTSSKVKDGSLEAHDFKAGTLSAAAQRGPTGPPGPAGPSGPAGPTGPAGAMSTIAASVTNSNPQTVNSSFAPSLHFDTEEFDTAGLHTGTDTRLTAPVDGVYEVAASVSFAANPVGLRQLLIAVNESEVNPPAFADAQALSGGPGTNLSVSGLVSLKAGEYVSAVVEQTSGIPLAVEGTEGARGPRLSMFRVGPLP